MSAPKICPLIAMGNLVHMSRCREDGCAWWTGLCCVVQQKNSLPDAANTEQAEGGKDLAGPDSTSTITENGGFVKCQ